MNFLRGVLHGRGMGADSFAVGRVRKTHEMAGAWNVVLRRWKKMKDGHPWHLVYLHWGAALTDWTPGQNAISVVDIQ